MVYWSLCVVFCCFGHLQTIFLQYLYLFPQALRSNRFLFRWYTNLDWQIYQSRCQNHNYRKWKLHIKKRVKVKFLTRTWQTIPRRWLLKKTNGRLLEQIKSPKPDIPKIALFSICFVTGEKMFGNPSESYFHLVDFSSFHQFLSIQFNYDRNWFIQCTGCQNDWLILSHASHYNGVGNLGKWN